MVQLVMTILLLLVALLVLAAAVVGIIFLIRKLVEMRNRKILNEIYLPMIKDSGVRSMIERYESKDQRTLALAYLCFGSKGAMPTNEAEEQLAELASSLEFAAEDNIPGYVDSLLRTLNHHHITVKFNWKKEFRYKIKVK